MKAGWEVRPLGEVCDLVGGGTPSKKAKGYYGGSIPWVTVRDMNVETVEITDHSITEIGLKNSSSKIIPKGEIIIASRVGLGKVCKLAADMAINQDLKGVIPKRGHEINRQFLFYWFQSVAGFIEENGVGATVQGVKLTFLNALPFPMVSLEEQERIVAVLDAAFEGLTRATEHAEANLQNARELFERQIARAFEAVESSKEAVAKTVAEIALAQKGSIRTGPFGSQLLHSEFTDKGIAVLGIDNAVKNEFQWGKRRFVSPKKYEALRRYTVRPGDVIITIMGTCGRCAVVPDDIPVAINTKHLCCITLDPELCLPNYLHVYFLHSEASLTYLNANASGSVMDGLNMGLIKELPVHLPSLSEQQSIADLYQDLKAKMIKLENTYRTKLIDIADLRQSLLQKAFAGELT